MPPHPATRRTVLLLAALLLAALPAAASACPYSIRESTFIRHDAPTMFRLYFLTSSPLGNRQQLAEWVGQASVTWLSEANVVAEVVDVDSPRAEDLERVVPDELLRHESLPVAVLVSPRGAVHAIPGLSPENTSLDTVMAVTRHAVDSPLRRQMSEHLVQAWCVLLVLEGSDAEENERAARAAEQAAEQITGTTTELDKVIANSPQVISVSPHDAEEQVALFSLGLIDSNAVEADASAVRVAMVTGRGEKRGPVLRGEAVTSDNIFELLKMIGRSCSCTTDAVWLTGPVLPMEWNEGMEAAVRDELGYDPLDPEAVGAISDVMTGLDSVLGYRELSIDDAIGQPAAPVDAGIAPPVESQDADASLGATSVASTAPVSRPRPASTVSPAAAPPIAQSPSLAGQRTLGLMMLAVLIAMVAATYWIIRRSRQAV